MAIAAAELTAPPIAARRARLDSVDLVRGLIMVVMAIDHVRDMLGPRADPGDLATTTLPLFLTRLVTHLCAPGFVLLAGTGAFLSNKPPRALSRFLLLRGLWLVVLELTVVHLAWAFNFWPPIALQVLWVLGWSMVALAALVRLPLPAIASVGLAMIGLHNLLDGIRVEPLLGGVFRMEPARRRRMLVGLGCAACATFVTVRALNGYGDPWPWSPQQSPVFTALSFLRTAKYPPSLDYLLMTLGPVLLLLAAAEGLRGPIARALIVFGRVPFFFYVLHLYLLHALALTLGVATGFPAAALLPAWRFFPRGFGVGLGAVWVVWLLVVAALYLPCRWFARVKAARRDWWLSYL